MWSCWPPSLTLIRRARSGGCGKPRVTCAPRCARCWRSSPHAPKGPSLIAPPASAARSLLPAACCRSSHASSSSTLYHVNSACRGHAEGTVCWVGEALQGTPATGPRGHSSPRAARRSQTRCSTLRRGQSAMLRRHVQCQDLPVASSATPTAREAPEQSGEACLVLLQQSRPPRPLPSTVKTFGQLCTSRAPTPGSVA